MFSANENILLREHKKRVVKYVEETIPEEALDMGTSVMVMQTACRTPGCVPLETAIAIIFPRPLKGSTSSKELVPGVKESGNGGSFKTKVLLPLSEVTKDDVLDALPPGFNGGRKTWENTCLSLRDLVIGRIGGLVGSGDTEAEIEDRRLLAEYLRQSLTDYLARNCKAPELGMPFLDLINKDEFEESIDSSKEDTPSEPMDDKDQIVTGKVVQGTMTGGGNFVFRRASTNQNISVATSRRDYSIDHLNNVSNRPSLNTNIEPNDANASKKIESANDWRRRQNMAKSFEMPSSNDMLSRLSERQHEPGVRSPGCPCCDPESLNNIVDQMMF